MRARFKLRRRRARGWQVWRLSVWHPVAFSAASSCKNTEESLLITSYAFPPSSAGFQFISPKVWRPSSSDDFWQVWKMTFLILREFHFFFLAHLGLATGLLGPPGAVYIGETRWVQLSKISWKYFWTVTNLNQIAETKLDEIRAKLFKSFILLNMRRENLLSATGSRFLLCVREGEVVTGDLFDIEAHLLLRRPKSINQRWIHARCEDKLSIFWHLHGQSA